MTYLYILYRRKLYKIGITKDIKQRIRGIQKAKTVICMPLFFADKHERFLHRRYDHLRTVGDVEDESGKTEWFKFWLPFRPVAWLLLFFVLEWGGLGLFIYFLIWL